MQIVAAATNLEEVDRLLDLGADIIYCGVLSKSIFDDHVVGGYNHRENTLKYNFKNILEIVKAITLVHQKGKRVSFVANEIGYTKSEIDQIRKDINFLIDNGIDSVIISDISLLLALKNEKRIKIVLSTLSNCFNSESLHFFEKLGISIAVLPQHLTAKEVKPIKESTHLELEVFFHEVSNCINIDGMCYFHNPNPNLFSGVKNYKIPCLLCSQLKQEGSEIKPQIFTNRAPRFDSYSELYDFHRMGIEYIKLGSRGSHSSKKYLQIKIVRELLKILDNKKISKKEFVEYAYKLTRDKGSLI